MMFERISDCTELLLPEDMLTKALRAKVVEAMSDEDCKDMIIGWLYQFYISEKRRCFKQSLKNQKITPSNIPAATQLYNHIDREAVENSG